MVAGLQLLSKERRYEPLCSVGDYHWLTGRSWRPNQKFISDPIAAPCKFISRDEKNSTVIRTLVLHILFAHLNPFLPLRWTVNKAWTRRLGILG